MAGRPLRRERLRRLAEAAELRRKDDLRDARREVWTRTLGWIALALVMILWTCAHLLAVGLAWCGSRLAEMLDLDRIPRQWEDDGITNMPRRRT